VSDAQASTQEKAAAPAAAADLPERIRRHRRHTLELLTVCALGLVPWTVLLAMTLPSVYEVRQWRVTWVGFDALLMVAMAATALLGWLRHRAVIVSATTTAVLLICDAWFDVSLAFGTSGVWLSAVLAACVELPLAFYLIRRVMGMLSLAQWPIAKAAADNSTQPARPDA
jgi:hypothetical protein